ncbi:MAG: MFS transporter permease [Desulfobacter sp.]|nr:MAG: MFS transporter permease [Desulfobacter sp.]
MAPHHKTIVIPKEKAVFRMDGNGIWHNEHGRFEHPKIISHFNRSIQKDNQGYFLSQMIDDQREEKVYFPYEETAVFAVDVRSKDTGNEGETIVLVLNTTDRFPLDPSTLFIRNDSLYIDAPDHLIKFSQQALAKMVRRLEDTDQGLALKMGGTETLIPQR